MPTLQVAINSQEAVRGAEQYNAAVRGMRTATEQGQSQVQKYEKQLGSLGQAAMIVKQTLIQTAAAVGVGYGVQAGVSSTIRTFIQFEDTLKTIQAVSGATGKELMALETIIRGLGTSTEFTANQAAQGVLLLSKAGLDSIAAVKALPAVLDLATAGSIELGQAADLANNIVNSFGLGIDGFRRVADVLVKTDISATTSVEELGMAFKFAAPLAKTAGQTLETTAAAIGILSNSSIKGALAGTSIRQVLATLLDPTKELKVVMQELNIPLAQLNPATNSLVEIMQRLKDANISAEQSVRAFSSRGVAAVSVLTANIDAFRELEKAEREVEGASRTISHIMGDDLDGALQRLKATLQDLVIALGRGGFGDAARDAIEFSSAVAKEAMGIKDAHNEASEAVKLTADALRFLIAAGITFVALRLPAVFVTLAKAVGLVNAAMLANPWVLTATAIATTVGAITLLKDETISFGETSVRVGAIVQQSWEFMKTFFSDVADSIKPQTDRIFQNLKDMAGIANDLYTAVSRSVSAAGKTLPKEPGDYEGVFGGTETFDFERDTSGAASVVVAQQKTYLDDIQDTVSGWLDSVKNIYTEAAATVDNVVQAAATQTETEKKTAELLAKLEELKASSAKVRQKVADEFAEYNQQVDAATQEMKAAHTQMQQVVKDLQFEQSIVRETTRDRELATASRQFEMLAVKAQSNDVKGLVEQYKKEFTALKDAEELRAVADNIGDAFGNTFLDIVTGANSAAEAMQKLGQEIARLILQKTIAEPISESISGGIQSLFPKKEMLEDTVGLAGGLTGPPSEMAQLFGATELQAAATAQLTAATALTTSAASLTSASVVLQTAATTLLTTAGGGGEATDVATQYVADFIGGIAGGTSTPSGDIVGLPGGPAGPPSNLTAKRFASGGLVTHPTYGMIGEAGPELIIPLTDPGGRKNLQLGGMLGNIPWRQMFFEGGPLQNTYNSVRELFRQATSGQGIAAGGRLLTNLGAIGRTAIPDLSKWLEQISTFGPENWLGSAGALAGGTALDVAGFALNKLIPEPSLPLLFSNPTAGLAAYGYDMFRNTISNPRFGLPGEPAPNPFQRFASGGIVDRMTMFSQGSGRSGMMGEAGPEAVMPLTRDSKGRLGVANVGGGGGPTIINMNIRTADADSFRKSKRQIVSDMKRIAK